MRATPLTERELTHLRGVLTELYEQNGRHTRKTAQAIGWTKASVSDVLNGRCGVGVGLLTRLSKVTGRPIDDLLGRSTSRAGMRRREVGESLRCLRETFHASPGALAQVRRFADVEHVRRIEAGEVELNREELTAYLCGIFACANTQP